MSPAADARGPVEYRKYVVRDGDAGAAARCRPRHLREGEDGKTHVKMKVNGAESKAGRAAHAAVHFLREDLQLTGTISAASDALRRLHGRPRRHVGEGCTMFAVQAMAPTSRRSRAWLIRTARCLPSRRLPDDARAAVRLLHARRIIRAQRLLRENPSPSEEEIRFGISGNLCRCTGYQNIVRAIQYAAARINGAEFKEAAMNDMTPTREQREAGSRAWAASANVSRTSASRKARATMSTT